MNRLRVLLALPVLALFLFTCAPMQEPSPGPPNIGPKCRTEGLGERNPDAPTVCVDDSADILKVDPEPFWLHERPSPAAVSAGAGAGGSPVVQFITRSGNGELQVRFEDERCVRNVVCNGGKCTAVAAKLDPGEKQRRCKYDVMLTGHPTLDPEGVLTECCVPGGGG